MLDRSTGWGFSSALVVTWMLTMGSLGAAANILANCGFMPFLLVFVRLDRNAPGPAMAA